MGTEYIIEYYLSNKRELIVTTEGNPLDNTQTEPKILNECMDHC